MIWYYMPCLLYLHNFALFGTVSWYRLFVMDCFRCSCSSMDQVIGACHRYDLPYCASMANDSIQSLAIHIDVYKLVMYCAWLCYEAAAKSKCNLDLYVHRLVAGQLRIIFLFLFFNF